jgi:hypothetical protein
MTIAQDMVAAAVECVRTPGRISIWSKRLGRYVCAKDPGFEETLAEQSAGTTAGRAPISAAFKLVFLTAGEHYCLLSPAWRRL